MSRTDKTNPDWVKTARREGNVRPWREHHRHDSREYAGVCEVRDPLPRARDKTWYPCTVWCSYRDNGKIYGRRPKRATRKALGRDRALRHDLVRLRRLWLWQDPEDIDSLENAPVNHRYLYDPWDWD